MSKVLYSVVIFIYLAVLANASVCHISIVSSPKLGTDVVCLNQTVSLTCQCVPAATITWHWLNQSKEGVSITVQATQHDVLYTCKASNSDGQMGEARINVSANGSPPHVRLPPNFHHGIVVDNGGNLNLTAIITSVPPLLTGPAWKVTSGINHDLPQSATVINYTNDGVLYSNLLLYNLSYNENSGNYTCLAGNKCGRSSVTVNIIITKDSCGNCNDSEIKIIGSSQHIITVPGEHINFTCLVQGDLCSLGFALTHYWMLNFPPYQDHRSIYIDTTNNSDHYRMNVYSNCKSCCNYTSQLTILSVPPELNGTITVTCTEKLWILNKKIIQQSTSTLVVLIPPKVTSSSDSKVCSTTSNVTLYCSFTAAIMEGVTVIVWEKDGLKIDGYDNETEPVQGRDNELISTLHINNFSYEDQGEYTCHCFYNESLVRSHEPITSDQAKIYVEANCKALNPSNSQDHEWIFISPSLGFVCIAIIIFLSGGTYILLKAYERSSSVPHSWSRLNTCESTTHNYRNGVSCSNYNDNNIDNSDISHEIHILHQIMNVFCTSVNLNELSPYLSDHGLLTPEEASIVIDMGFTNHEKAGKIFERLKRKGTDTPQKLLCCLTIEKEHAGHKSIAEKLASVMRDNGIKHYCPKCEENIQLSS